MSRVHRLERRIDEKLREMLRSSSPDQAREPIEVYRAILDEVTSRIDTVPRGRLIFAYSRVSVRVLLTNPERRRSYELIFTDQDSLTRDIRSYFEENKVEFPTRFKVDVELVSSMLPEIGERGFEVNYSNPPVSVKNPDATRIRLRVLVGNAEAEQYEFAKPRVNIGRLAEVVDSHMRTVRRNDVAFKDDSTGENSTVSRAHAHLEYDPDTKSFRLFDDGSARGTIVIRGGSVTPIPQGNSQGVLLKPGDEIILGRVRIQYEYPET